MFYGLAMSTVSDCPAVEAGVTAIQDMACVGGAEWSNYCPQGCSERVRKPALCQ